MTAALSAAAGVVSHIFKYPSVRKGRRNSGLSSLPFLSRGGRGEREKVTAGTKQRKIFFKGRGDKKETDASSTARRKRKKKLRKRGEETGRKLRDDVINHQCCWRSRVDKDTDARTHTHTDARIRKSHPIKV